MQFKVSGSPILAGVAAELELGVSGRAIESGDHGCLPFEDEEHFLQHAVPFVLEGLAAGETVVCVLDLALDFRLMEKLTSEQRSRILSIPASQQYGQHFDPDRTLRRYRSTFSNLDGPVRIIGGLDPGGAREADPEEWERYEKAEHVFFTECDATSLCVFDLRSCSDALIGAMRKTHAIVAGKHGYLSNPVYEGSVLAA